MIQTLIVALGFEGLVVEVLDRLVIQQGVDCARVRHGVQFIDLLSKMRSPLRDLDREHDIKRQGKEGDHGKPRIVLVRQNRQHQHHFNQSGYDAVQGIGDQGLNASDASFNVAGHAASLTLQVKAQTQTMQMLKGLQCNLSGRPLGGFGKHQLPEFCEARHRQTQQAIRHQQRHGCDKHCRRPIRALSQGRWGRHGIDQLLQHQGHTHIRKLGADHERQRQKHTKLVGPKIGQQAL